jgi:HAD superfamily hydrolase (TIGR01549 family)
LTDVEKPREDKSGKPFVLFDLGETLVDLQELLVALATNLANRYPNLQADVGHIVRRWIVVGSQAMPRSPGQPFAPEFEVASRVMAQLLRDRGIRLTDAEAGTILREGWDDFETRVRFVGGVTEDWLREIHGLSAGLAIVTDGDRENVERLLRRLPLAPYFQAIVTSEDVRSYKPNAPIYERALRALEASPSRTLFVSDSAQDLRGAAELGIATALLGRPLIDVSSDLPAGSFRLTEPRQLSQILQQYARTGEFRPAGTA